VSLQLTAAALRSVEKIKKEPSIVVIFDGIAEVFGSASIFRYIKIGDDGLLVGNNWVIGGRVAVPDQVTAISFDGTSTKISYSLNPDLAVGEAVSSMTVRLVDDRALTILGVLAADEFLGRKCRILLSPDSTDTAYPDDYITIFRGVVDDIAISPGAVTLTVSHPDTKKRQAIFASSEGDVNEALDASETTITLVSTADLIAKITGPSGAVDTAFKTYIKVDDEIIEYTGVAGADLTGCVRGSLNTVAATHSTGAAWSSFYRLNDSCIDLALKLMLSGWNGNFKTGVVAASIGFVNVDTPIASSIFFRNVNISEQYGLTVGDYITTVGSAIGGNNLTLKVITAVVVTAFGSYVTIAETLTDEIITTATVSFRSRYDTLGDGLKMSPDEVDVEQHTRLRSLFLSTFTYDLYVKATIESAKEFISSELYKPIACYSVPRKARSSVAYTVGPLPLDDIKIIDDTNTLDANKIVKKRSLGRNFYNTIIYKYNEDSATDIFLRGLVTTNATSRTQIPIGTKAFIIESRGLRDSNVAVSASNRRLNRYAFAADYISQVTVTFEAGFNIEVADLVVLDGEALKISDGVLGTNTTPVRFYEVISKSLDLITGRVTFSLTNTNYADAGRYALISPASKVKSGISASAFVIESSHASVFGGDEYKKWDRYGQSFVRVRSADYTTAATAQIASFSGNTINLSQSLGFTPSAGMIMEFSGYSQASDQIKLLYTHITNATANFPDGGKPYVMI